MCTLSNGDLHGARRREFRDEPVGVEQGCIEGRVDFGADQLRAFRIGYMN